MNSCVFVSIDDGTTRNDFPNSGNIIKRGDTEVGAVHHFIKTVVTSSKEGGASAGAGAEAVDEDAVDMEENDVTIGGMDDWKNVAECIQSFPITRHPKHVGLRKQQVERDGIGCYSISRRLPYNTRRGQNPLCHRVPRPTKGKSLWFELHRNAWGSRIHHQSIRWRLEKGLYKRITKIFGECYQPATLLQNGVSISNRPKQFHKRRKGGLAVVQN
mmetsp:Transcript_26013/g.39315  ORF Transcript_26013/g.39315 Transcript_26013/m.39315 type:complete len:215 (+) Transcript_26013:470-1114(+)